ncbi:MAG: bifunctional riboflavin kinase/FAD synthetase [Clostridiales bacterium]|nr:bifunctional riboflavin kinase/FAD synthetase [Clostridiales bacterium]
MKVWRGWPEGEDGLRYAAIGTFDGVHRGHQAILQQLLRGAREAGAKAWVVTFEPHPQAILRGASPPLLTLVRERLYWLEEAGVEGTVILPFTPELAATPAEVFLQEELCRKGKLRRVYVGYNFTFGKGAAGNAAFLQKEGPRACGLEVTVVPPVVEGGEAVSSTRIRKLLLEGNLEEAERLLGRPFSLFARVGRGDGRGKELGFPTANLEVDAERALPPPGVYAGWAVVEGRSWPAAISVGARPMVPGDDPRRVEVYVVGWNGELYGQEIQVGFFARLRDQEAFPSWEVLKEAMVEDVNQVLRVYQSRLLQ